MKYIAVFLTLIGTHKAMAIENFHCLFSLAQQVDPMHIKDAYSVEGEQNPPLITFDYKGPALQEHYLRVVATGNYIHELEPTRDSSESALTVKFIRVYPDEPTMPDLPDGVRLKLESSYGSTYAGLGMRDNYNTYAQSVTIKLHNGKKGLVMVSCLR